MTNVPFQTALVWSTGLVYYETHWQNTISALLYPLLFIPVFLQYGAQKLDQVLHLTLESMAATGSKSLCLPFSNIFCCRVDTPQSWSSIAHIER